MSVISEIIPTFQRWILRLVQIIVSRILSLWYGGETTGIPTPKSSLLMESASSLANKIRNEKVTSTEVVKVFIERINEVNDILNCVVDKRFEEALDEARKVDELIASGSKTKEELERETPFLGVPFTVKDSIAVTGLLHSAGIRARKNLKAEKDAEVVRLMRKAGGIPLAVTNVSELCYWWETNNPVFGKTKNPYNLNRTAGGSSGGEACLITSCGSPIGIGSDIGGSIRIPAAFNGIFGHKPSGEVTPLGGLFPNPVTSQSQYNTVGPMSRFASDLLPALKVMTAQSNVDLKLDEKVNIKSLRFYYLESDGGGNLLSPVESDIKAAILKVVEHLKKTYDVVPQKLNTNKFQQAHHMWITRMTEKNEPELAALLTNNQGKVNVKREIFKSLLGLSQHTLATLFMAYMEETATSNDTLKRCIYERMRIQLRDELKEILGTDGVLIYPTQPTAALYHYESLVKPFNYAYTGIFNILGLPATHCPMGMNADGLPIGVQVIAGKHQDRLTIAVAEEIEKAFNGWRPSPTTGILVLKNRSLIKSGS